MINNIRRINFKPYSKNPSEKYLCIFLFFVEKSDYVY